MAENLDFEEIESEAFNKENIDVDNIMEEQIEQVASNLGSKQSHLGGKASVLKKPVSAFILFMSDLKNDAEFKK